MFNRHHRKARLLFALSDVVLIALAFEIAYQIRLALPAEHFFFLTTQVKALLLGASIVAYLLIGDWLKLYDRLDTVMTRAVLRDTARQVALATIVVVLLEYLLRLDLSRAFLLMYSVGSLILLALFRWKSGSLAGIIRREFGAPHYVMVVGTGDHAVRVGDLLERSADYGVRLVGFLRTGADDNCDGCDTLTLRAQYPVYPIASLPELLQRQIIDEIIFAVDARELSNLEEIFLLCDEEGVRTHLAVGFFPHVNSSIHLDRLGPAPLLTFSPAPHDEVLLFMKRSIDVAIAGTALVLLSPVMLLVALLVKLTSPGPVIFRQIRCGLNGRRFVCYKFRSMCEGAEKLRPSLEHLSEREIAFKVKNDPRLTPVGGLLRKFSIDEWPQLWNVVKGEMSLVGPRPAVPEEVERYKRWQRRRLRMRPGLTCLWAIKGRDNIDFETWMKLDMQYIDAWSLALDWKIILRTIPHVLLGKGAH